MNDIVIQTDTITKTYESGANSVQALKGIELTVHRGEFLAIMGASGSGKSTLLGLLAGLDTPTAGDVHLNGTAISYLPEDKLAQVRGKTVGFVVRFQGAPRAYLNRCAHVGIELDWQHGKFFDGSRLRMVSWRSGKAVYWISNTLLSSLGNQQMLALAQSVGRIR